MPDLNSAGAKPASEGRFVKCRWLSLPLALTACLLGVASPFLWQRYCVWVPMFKGAGMDSGLAMVLGACFDFVYVAPCLGLQLGAYACFVTALSMSRRTFWRLCPVMLSGSIVLSSTVILVTLVAKEVTSKGL